MKDAIVILIMQLPAAILCGGAIYLAANDKPGWGWMLFVALILAVTRGWHTRLPSTENRSTVREALGDTE